MVRIPVNACPRECLLRDGAARGKADMRSKRLYKQAGETVKLVALAGCKRR